jgi:hypothetical protein
MTARTPKRDPEDLLIEQTLGAHRELDVHGVPMAPAAWSDLSSEGRVRAFRAQVQMRTLEAALDENGWNSTVKAVLARLR